MSAETEQAIHDAIAVHIADINEDDPEYLTEWCVVASAVISTDADSTVYYYVDSSLPFHHSAGLLAWGKTHINETRLMSSMMDDED